MSKVLILMGSDSDLPIMREAANILNELGIENELRIASAHRTPDKVMDLVTNAKDRGIKVIIAGAGCAAHLPGVAAAFTALPVIGVPIHTKILNGVDALYSIVQMPSGVPVATVAINGALNAGLLAAQIIGSSDDSVYSKMIEYKNGLRDKVLAKAALLEVEV